MKESETDKFIKDIISNPNIKINDFDSATGEITVTISATSKMPTEEDYLKQIDDRQKKIKESEKKLLNLNESDATDEHIRSLLQDILSFDTGNGIFVTPSTCSISKVEANKFLFRIRHIDSKMETMTDAWYPPEKYISRLGRLNDINESVLYIADDIETAMMECRTRIGDRFHLIVYKTIQDINLIDITASYVPKTQYSKLSFLISDFLSTIFSLNVKENENYKYKISNQIGKFFFSYSMHNLDGWAYPSAVMENKKSIALNPKSCDKKLRISFVAQGHLKEKSLVVGSYKYLNSSNELIRVNKTTGLNELITEFLSKHIKNTEEILKDTLEFREKNKQI